jgi:hypothetical protein
MFNFSPTRKVILRPKTINPKAQKIKTDIKTAVEVEIFIFVKNDEGFTLVETKTPSDVSPIVIKY